MDIKEFAKELSEATKDMSDEQRATVRKMFEKVADQLDAPVASAHEHVSDDEPYDVPDGPTDRQVRLKENFLKQVPTIFHVLCRQCRANAKHLCYDFWTLTIVLDQHV